MLASSALVYSAIILGIHHALGRKLHCVSIPRMDLGPIHVHGGPLSHKDCLVGDLLEVEVL